MFYNRDIGGLVLGIRVGHEVHIAIRYFQEYFAI
jgi:hypothetical protein